MDRRHAPRTHGLHAGAQPARRVPTLPADDLVYTTCEISVITRYRSTFEIVRAIAVHPRSIAASRMSEK
ncbi:hypothetical protein BURCENK562V_C2043 [Burkholderia cenocepacia K56-2Valvano]|nr:hypothetical protein BURCENK562V_C2043 [Burkholderia cenocepacia K56-2Valvano]